MWLHCYWNYISECFSDSLTFFIDILILFYGRFYSFVWLHWIHTPYSGLVTKLLIDIVFHPTCLRSSVHEVPTNCKQKIYPSCTTVCIVWDIKLSIYLQYCAKILQILQIHWNSLLFDKLWSKTKFGQHFDEVLRQLLFRFIRNFTDQFSGNVSEPQKYEELFGEIHMSLFTQTPCLWR